MGRPTLKSEREESRVKARERTRDCSDPIDAAIIIEDAELAAAIDDLVTPLAAAETETGYSTADCLITIRDADSASGVEFRECLIDYTRCSNSCCIKRLQ